MLTIHELHEKLVNGDVSAVELTKAFLAHKDTVCLLYTSDAADD